MLTPKSSILLLFHTPIKNEEIKLKRNKVKNVNQKLQSLYSGEGSSQANKTSQKDWLNKLEFKLKNSKEIQELQSYSQLVQFLIFQKRKEEEEKLQ